MWLLVALLAVPIIEIALFIQVGGVLGLWPTLALVIATAFLGAALLRAQGAGAMAQLRHALAEGQDPALPLIHGAVILVAGVFLLTPGFFTDAFGLALLVPPLRKAFIAGLGRHLMRNVVVMGAATGSWRRTDADGDVVDGEYEEVRSDEMRREEDARQLPRRDGRG